MAEVYEFDPAADLRVIETFTFEEEVDRPESLRFYTLDDQITDYFEKRVPIGKVSRRQLEQLEKDAMRVRDLYNEIIIGTDTDFEVRKERPHRGFLPWITPVYAGAYATRPWDWSVDYRPLFASRQPRFYERLMPGLPRPYQFADTGKEARFFTPQRFVDTRGERPIRALPVFERTKAVLHAGGQLDIVSELIPSTKDVIPVQGYWIGKRSLDLVSPLADHPILGTNDAHFVETPVDYAEVVPSVEAILDHAVPMTTHPFRDAAPYLKLYDIKWSEIAYPAWKRHFPAADPVSDGLPPDPIPVPTASRDLPSETLQKYYSVKYRPGLAPRLWLMMQEDGGTLVQKLMLSLAGEQSPITLPNPSALTEPTLARATPSDCLPDGITFETLVTAGLYRPPGVCVPLDTIARERAEAGTKGRLPWGETTQADILSDYLLILQAAQSPPEEPKEPILPKVDVPPVSQNRQDVLTILGDETRSSEDKARDIRVLVNDMPLRNHLFLDNDERFLVCEHTMALLGGDLGRNQRTFYETWCATVDGFRVCKFCGEAVNRDVFVNIDEFDDAGHSAVHAETEGVAEFHPGHVRTFTESLQQIRLKFDTKDPAQDMFFLLISVLQVLPEAAFLDPVLGQVKRLSAFTASKGASAQAVYGICGMALLMQIHDPFLVPRRSFGSPFITTGFPRDGGADDPGILDSLVNALKRTFEQFRGALRGSSTPLLRELFRTSGKVREKCVTALKVMSRPPPMFIQKLQLHDYSEELAEAAARYAKAPDVPASLNILVPNRRIDTTAPAKNVRAICLPATGTSLWSTSTPPVYMQAPTTFSGPTLPGSTARQVDRLDSKRIEWSDLPSTTAARLAKGSPAFLKTSPLAATLQDRSISAAQAIAIAGRLLDLAARPDSSGSVDGLTDLRSLRLEFEQLDPTVNPSQLRDAARGIAYEVLARVQANARVREAWARVVPKDVTLRALLKTREELAGEVRSLVTAERETFKTRLGEKSDMERDLIKQLLDIGLAPYVITVQDRQLFAQQLEQQLAPPIDPLGNPDVPEEGFPIVPTDAERDDADQGERGDFGDMPNRPYEGNDEYGSADPERGV